MVCEIDYLLGNHLIYPSTIHATSKQGNHEQVLCHETLTSSSYLSDRIYYIKFFYSPVLGSINIQRPQNLC